MNIKLPTWVEDLKVFAKNNSLIWTPPIVTTTDNPLELYLEWHYGGNILKIHHSKALSFNKLTSIGNFEYPSKHEPSSGFIGNSSEIEDLWKWLVNAN